MEQVMNNTTKEILTELLPEMAIIVYKNNNKRQDGLWCAVDREMFNRHI